MRDAYENWGRRGGARQSAIALDDLPPRFSRAGGYLPFGNGRSYGDSCHNSAGTLVEGRRRNAILGFDGATGILEAESGATLATILALVVPQGFFLPVTPGTAHVTLGGAIANDVHGKNHHARGTFGAHVESFRLRRSDGRTLTCSPVENPDLFAATIGGMGLTGIILTARIRLMRVASPDIRQHAIRFEHIDGYFDRVDAIDAAHEYSVAWIDQLATGKRLGRGILLAGGHAREALPVRQRRQFSVPFAPPVNCLNSLTLKAFNEAYFRKIKRGENVCIVAWRSFFYPLDAITGWNRLYGPRGLFQHQSVYPVENARETTVRLMECARAHGHASFLTVLKRFGEAVSPGLFSFARPGFTLTLDFANRGSRTLRMLDALDEIVLAAGGAVNPYKDARMSAETFAASFPGWQVLERHRDPAMMSDLWRRTAMRLSDNPETAQARKAEFWHGLSGSGAFEPFPSPGISDSRARDALEATTFTRMGNGCR